MVKSYTTIYGRCENTEIIERSKFITYITNVNDEEDAKEFVKSIKKANSLATHNCYAYIADKEGNVQKFSDDGEPQGTAGLPMLETLKSLGLTKVCAVITRYFGGIKLGTGGLARAYSGGVKNCVEKGRIVTLYLAYENTVEMDFALYNKFVSAVSNNPTIRIVNTDFNDKVMVSIAVKEDDIEKASAFLSSFFSKETELKKEKVIYTDF